MGSSIDPPGQTDRSDRSGFPMTTKTIPAGNSVLGSFDPADRRVAHYTSDDVEDSVNMRIVEAISHRVDERVQDLVYMHLRDRLRNG